MGGMGKANGSDDALESLLDALKNEDDDEEDITSLFQSYLQKNGAQYGSSGLFGTSTGFLPSARQPENSQSTRGQVQNNIL